MEKSDIIAFFDQLAPDWDADQVPRDAVINRILDNAQIGEHTRVLDVACGTGILFPFYLRRGVPSVTGVDISAEMVNIAKKKFSNHSQIQIICGDIEEISFTDKFDSIMVHNAFPHFPDPERLIKILSGMLAPHGRLTIAHSFSREMINAHHQGVASKVSMGLMSADDLKSIFEKWLEVDICISDSEMYQVSGINA